MTATTTTGRTHITEETVREIRRRYRNEATLTYSKLGEEYGRSPLSMHLLVTGKTWKQIPGALESSRDRVALPTRTSPLTSDLVREMVTFYNADPYETHESIARRFALPRPLVSQAFRDVAEWLPNESLRPRKAQKGARRGEQHPMAVIPDAKVREMRELRASDKQKYSFSYLAALYNMSVSGVSLMIRGKSRRDAGGPIEADATK